MMTLKNAGTRTRFVTLLTGFAAAPLLATPATAQDMKTWEYIAHAASCSVLVFVDPPEHLRDCGIGERYMALTTLAAGGSGNAPTNVAPLDPPYVPPPPGPGPF